jgi:hypothetical protein
LNIKKKLTIVEYKFFRCGLEIPYGVPKLYLIPLKGTH